MTTAIKAMKPLIPMDDMGVFANSKYEMLIDSRMVADYFERDHKNVIQAIERVRSEESGFSKEFNQLNFQPVNYVDKKGETRPMYIMTRDGFTALAMGFTGKKAAAFKEAYIKRFNEMEAQLASLQALRDMHPSFLDAITTVNEEVKPYHYSNEFDMINRIVLGKTSKQFRQELNIPKDTPIRPYMSADDAELMKYLQIADVGMLLARIEYQQRKLFLTASATSFRERLEKKKAIEAAKAAAKAKAEAEKALPEPKKDQDVPEIGG